MGAFFARSNDGLGIILKFVLEFAIKDWRTNCKLINADYERFLAQSHDGFGDHIEIVLKYVLEFAIEGLGNQLSVLKCRLWTRLSTVE